MREMGVLRVPSERFVNILARGAVELHSSTYAGGALSPIENNTTA